MANCWICNSQLDMYSKCATCYDKIKAENDLLRKAISTAPHNMGCASLQGGPTRPGWGKLEFCDCWKKETLEIK
jgi:hypothetical protein